MGLARVHCVALAGVDGQPVEVECDISSGLPGLSFTGLADTSVLESRDRVRSAIVNSGLPWPNRKITVALFPADVRKVGSRFDLAVALAVLSASGTVPGAATAEVAWIAELSLDGRLRAVRGVLPAVLAARRHGIRRVVVAPANAAEAALVSGVDVRYADHLAEIHGALVGTAAGLRHAEPGDGDVPADNDRDLVEIAGHSTAKRALEIAAAGGHNVYLVGPPGAGKTMLAERLPGLLPELDDESALEVTAIHSVAGALEHGPALVRRPPWQAPHHTASIASLVGGGSYQARPGVISMAHRGVLFLDEAPEFAPAALDSLRQPLESGLVTLSRSGGAVTYPARFQLVLAANPCGCSLPAQQCVCRPAARRRHLQRLSGPLLDRIDLRLHVEPVPRADLMGAAGRGDTSAQVACRVARARAAATERWQCTRWRANADIPGSVLRSPHWMPPPRVIRPAERCLENHTLSARGLDRVLRLAWSIADLDGRPRPDEADLAEALSLRLGGEHAWAA